MRVAFLYVHCAVEKGRASRDCRWIGWLLREFERKNYWKLGVTEAEYEHIYDETKGAPGAVSSRQSLSNRGSKADIPRASVGFFPWGPRHLLDGSTHEPCTAAGTKASVTSPDRTSLAEPSWARPLQWSCPSLDLILSFMSSRSPVLPSPQAASTCSFQAEAHPLSSSHFSLSCSVSNSQTPECHRGPSSGLFLPLCPGPVRSYPATRIATLHSAGDSQTVLPDRFISRPDLSLECQTSVHNDPLKISNCTFRRLLMHQSLNPAAQSPP